MVQNLIKIIGNAMELMLNSTSTQPSIITILLINVHATKTKGQDDKRIYFMPFADTLLREYYKMIAHSMDSSSSFEDGYS